MGEIIPGPDLGIVCIGKNSTVPPRFVVRRGTVLGTDLLAEDVKAQFPDGVVPANAQVSFRGAR